MKNWKYIEGAKTGNADNWRSYDEMIKKAKHDLEVIKQKEREATSFSKKQDLASARREIEDKLKYYQKQTGNIKDDAKAKELHKKMMDAKENAEEWGRASNYQKKDNLEGGRKAAEDAYRKAKKEYEDYAMNSKTGAEEFFKQLSDDVKEREKKDDADIEKVGNRTISNESEMSQELKNLLKQANPEWKDKVSFAFSHGFDIDENDFINAIKKDLQNKRTGNVKDKNDRDLKVGDVVDVRGKKGKITKIIGDVIEVFYDNRGTYNPDRTDRHYADEATKVGNSKTGNVQYHNVGKITIKLEANDDDWTVYDESGNELKSGKGGLGRAKTWAEHFSRFTNKRTGNKEYSTDDFKRIKEEALRIAQTTKDEEKKKRALKIADYMKYAHNQPDWGKIVDRYDAELKQIGNSASNDKFAYVMREFDAGKLKTPDGKVVTDPAQAKAIAYSESKKTENGLARARKAMNASSITYDDFLRKLENAINQGRDSVSFQMYGISNQTVETWVQKAKKEGYSQYIRDVRGAEVNLND